jgi:cytochrome o ubiquinol oxidase subunit 3
MSTLASGAPAGHRPAPIPRSEQGPASRRVVVAYGFWLFLLSDIILFSALFAAYAVLSGSTAGGPSGARLFHRPHVFVETVCLLLSSFTCGCMTLAIDLRSRPWMTLFAAATATLGLTFLGLELAEFTDLLAHGAGPSRSGFLSAFFALVGLHGSHVALGLVWLAVMMAQAWTLGLRPVVVGRLLCFALFWHALDIVWIGVFTIVYLGAR